MVQQDGHGDGMSCAGSQDERGAALLVPVLDVGAVGDEQFYEFLVTPSGRQSEGGVVVRFRLLVDVNGWVKGAEGQGGKVRGQIA